VTFALLTSNFAQFREEVQNGPPESVQYELVARRYADTPIRRYADTMPFCGCGFAAL
jgi:hypothetical protein